MQSKALILFLASLVAVASGAAAPTNEVDIIEESTGPLNARQADITWQATGGCKTDWYVSSLLQRFTVQAGDAGC
ncbi:hypothetical protein QBC36DRAFT_329923 [Triangularia setosa]|uniref:Uncharacterized protein n=1 Tax=Triangularia setosa TaxID=2587417 RepID=A0AAN6W6A3_9PEZI|nr:hypothetical protein QBC36DRAFT_329923 [Podospora setosa]